MKSQYVRSARIVPCYSPPPCWILKIGRIIAESSAPCRLAATEIGALGYAFPGRVIDPAGLVTPIALSIEPEEVLQQERAAWLVTQNIFLSPRIRDSAWFRREFALVESYPIAPGRSMDAFTRRSASCA